MSDPHPAPENQFPRFEADEPGSGMSFEIIETCLYSVIVCKRADVGDSIVDFE